MSVEEKIKTINEEVEYFVSNMSCKDCELNKNNDCLDISYIFEDDICGITYLTNRLATALEKIDQLNKLLKEK